MCGVWFISVVRVSKRGLRGRQHGGTALTRTSRPSCSNRRRAAVAKLVNDAFSFPTVPNAGKPLASASSARAQSSSTQHITDCGVGDGDGDRAHRDIAHYEGLHSAHTRGEGWGGRVMGLESGHETRQSSASQGVQHQVHVPAACPGVCIGGWSLVSPLDDMEAANMGGWTSSEQIEGVGVQKCRCWVHPIRVYACGRNMSEPWGPLTQHVASN